MALVNPSAAVHFICIPLFSPPALLIRNADILEVSVVSENSDGDPERIHLLQDKSPSISEQVETFCTGIASIPMLGRGVSYVKPCANGGCIVQNSDRRSVSLPHKQAVVSERSKSVESSIARILLFGGHVR